MNCPLHSREHTSGKLFCIACRLPVRKARYTSPPLRSTERSVPSRNKSAATKAKEQEYAKVYYRENKTPAKKPGQAVTG